QVIWAQNGIIRGQVIDDESGEPLFSANAILKGTQIGATTDFDGKFELSAQAGTYDMNVSFIGMSSITITGVVVKPGDVTVIDVIRLKPSSSELGEVTITVESVRNTEAAMITVKRKSANVIDGVSAAKLRKTGDSDAGDAAKRVTGVSVEGGKYVYVRGLGDRYTKTMLNGVDIPGLDPDRNAIQIDIFPTNLIDNMTVLKSALAEIPADFSGGVVNIETKDFPDREILNVSFGLGYNPAMHFNSNYLGYEGGAVDFLAFDDGTRTLPTAAEKEPIPNPVSPGFSDQQVTDFMNEFSPTLGAIRKTSLMDMSLGLSMGNQYTLESGNKIGYTFATTYKNSTRFYDNVIYGEYVRPFGATNYELEYTTKREGQLGENNVLLGGLAGIAYKTFNSKYQLTLMYLQNGESKAGQFTVDNSESTGQSGYRAFSNSLSYSQRSLTNLLFSGEHHKGNDEWVIDWRVSPTLSRIVEPDLRSTTFTITLQGDSVFNSGAGGNPSRYWRFLDEINAVGQLNFTKNFKWRDADAKLKFGASHIFKNRNYNILGYELQAFGPNPTYSGDPNAVLIDENIYENGSGLFYNSNNGNPNPNEYQSAVHNTGAYVSGEFSPFLRLKTIVGLRVENFIQTHTGRDQAGANRNGPNDTTGNVLDNEKVLSSIDLFPSANLIYALTENQNLRLSYFRSIARPSFKELSFAQILDPISNRIFNGGLAPYPNQGWDGNLTETRINNFDLRWELFMERGEYFAVSFFTKLFNDPIELVRIPEAQTNPEFQPRNVGDGEVYGAEIELTKSMAFVSPAFSKLSFSGNFTYVYSRIEMTETEYEARKNYEKEGQTIERTRAMAGQAPFIVNAGFS
ncbi:MAG: TonB-dependent receptor domain-containing protein, partial [Owenweeksia sp.]